MFSWKNKRLEKGKVGKRLVTDLTSYLILFMALGATAFFGVCSPNMSNMPLLSGAAASVGNEDISAAEFKRAYQSRLYYFQQIYQDKFDPAAMKLAENVLQDLVNQRLAYEQARSLGFASTKKEAENIIFSQFKDAGEAFNPENFKNYLRNMGYSEASLIAEIQRQATVQKFRQFFSQATYYAPAFAEMDYRIAGTKLDLDYLRIGQDDVKVSITPGDVSAFVAEEKNKQAIADYYNRNIGEFKREKRVKASHILISYATARNVSGAAETRKKDDARKLAETVLAEVKRAGSNFAALATKYTDEPSGKAKGGDLGYFAREDMVPEFSDAAFNLQPGQVSGIVESPFGFHIIKVTEVQPADERTLEQATTEIARKLIEKERKPAVAQKRAQEILDALQSGKGAQNLLADYKLSWKATGEFALDARSIPGLGANAELSSAALSMQRPGQLVPKVLDIDGSAVIVRLKKRVNPDMAKFDANKREELVDSGAQAFTGSLYRELNEKFEEKMKKDGRIKMSSDFLAIDRRLSENAGG